MEDRYLWELAGKKAAGEASEAELRELNRLLQSRPDVRYMLEMMENYWSFPAGGSEETEMADAWARHKKRLTQSYGQEASGAGNIRPVRIPFTVRRRILLMAASFTLLLATGLMMAKHNRSFPFSATDTNMVATKLGSKTRLLLPDSTVIWLNAGSKLSYPRHFERAPIREVTLSGEAFFEVKHDARHPFVIHTRYLDIKDIGTAFDVKAYPQDKMVEATLIRGAVEVVLRAHPKEKVVLRPNEKLSYNVGLAENGSFRKQSVPDSVQAEKTAMVSSGIPGNAAISVQEIVPVINPSGGSIVSETAWINNQLAFSNERFEDLAVRMGRWYNAKITIKDPEVDAYTFTGIFQGESVEEALKELQMIRPFHFTIHNDDIIISR